MWRCGHWRKETATVGCHMEQVTVKEPRAVRKSSDSAQSWGSGSGRGSGGGSGNGEEAESGSDVMAREQEMKTSLGAVTGMDNKAAYSFRAPRLAVTARDFSFGRLLGLGSYSKVVHATMKSTGEQYALKVMDKQHIMKERKGRYVKRERIILDNLDHPGIVRLRFTFQDEHSLYLGLELCAGGELFEQMRRRGRMPLEDARFYTAEIVDILAYLHAQGVVHRDLKPENLMLTADGHLKLTDFGSAKCERLSFDECERGYGLDERSSSFVGTADYVSPELLMSGPATRSTDLWALGCVVYQLLEGVTPFKAESEYLCFQKVMSRDFHIPDHFCPEARSLVDNLLDADPERRLGAGPGGYEALKSHPFFKGIDWKGVRSMAAPRPVSRPPRPIGEDAETDKEEDDDFEWEIVHSGAMDPRTWANVSPADGVRP